ncbi:FecR domain-containing protein [Neolewinella lacunae]|uniref:FecR domain-containing protein n=1 Tax=Neolewinella lacunae TaxID=1517758 RepID=A0A923T8E9_9BACT|nr:FecR domain-containing protein [Neolewinella lacunae]MBC6994496.1 FecR domain-containing protein [Neolewinella lacunae]MDN3634189.1 FecR domain-containing protein [Neolewinella lacunae]
MHAASDKEIDQLAGGYGAFQPDVAGGLRAVRLRIATNEIPAAPVRPLRPRRWYAVAAAAAVLLALGYFTLLAGNVAIANEDSAPLATVLPDGTEVLLQQGATLRYDRSFNRAERRVSLQGQAFFQVTPDLDRPFLVANAGTELRVTGTAFNLRIDGQEMEVEVSEGSVALQRGALSTPVNAGECGLAKVGKAFTVLPAPNLNRHAWRTGKLHFVDTPLSEVLQTIRNNFAVSVELSNDCDFPVAGTFRADNPAAVLTAIARLGGGQVTPLGGRTDAFQLSLDCQD